MTKDEALKLALEALEMFCEHGAILRPIETRDAIKEALAQPEQPKVRTGNCLRVGVCASEGHKIAPQRTWVGLTDEEIDIAWRSVDYTVPYSQFRIDIAKAIEAKLKEKNS